MGHYIVDGLIVFWLLFNVINGFKQGLARQSVELGGAIIGILLAFRWSIPVANWLETMFHLASGIENVLTGTKLALVFPGNIGGIITQVLSFCLIFAAVGVVVNIIAYVLNTFANFSFLSIFNRLGGAGLGLLKGGIVVCVVLFLVTLLPRTDLQKQIDQSYLAPKFVAATPIVYSQFEKVIPTTFPKLLVTSQGVQFRSIDFSKLEGATCVACGKPVHFVGYFQKGHYRSPKFVCTSCGRTSDGCQTYQGYHKIYGECPVVKGREGYQIDCRIWPNGKFVTPLGPCPVCGERGILPVKMQTN